MDKVALIANARSHLVATRGSRLAEVSRRYRSAPQVWFDTMASFSARIEDLLETGHDTFIMEGGDGTVLAALTSCYNHDPQAFGKLRFAILPGGSTNLAHEKLGLKEPSVERVTSLIASLRTDGAAPARITTHPTLVIEAGEHAPAQVGFLMSTGSLALGMEHVQRHMFTDGSRGAAAIALSLLRLAVRPYDYLAADGKPLLRPTGLEAQLAGAAIPAGPHAFSLVSTLDSFTLGISPFWGAGNGPIHFTHAAWPPGKLRRAILRAATRRNMQKLEDSGYRSLNASALTIRVEGPVMLDGERLELAPGTEIRVTTSAEVSFLR